MKSTSIIASSSTTPLIIPTRHETHVDADVAMFQVMVTHVVQLSLIIPPVHLLLGMVQVVMMMMMVWWMALMLLRVRRDRFDKVLLTDGDKLMMRHAMWWLWLWRRGSSRR